MLTRTQSRIEPALCGPVNPAHPLARGLAGCWLLNEGAGRVVHDAAGHHRDGSFSGGPIWSASRFGRAIDLDGTDDWISMGDCLDLGTDDVTVLAIVNYSAANQPDLWSSTRYGAIVGKGHLDGAGRGYGLAVNTGNKVQWQIRNQSTAFSAVSDNALNDGQWHLAIGVCDRDDSTGVRLYIDGVLQSTPADATTFNGIDLSGSRAFAIGSRQDETGGGWFWDFTGSIAMVCVWKRVLAEAEIRRLQQNPFEMLARRGSIAVLAPSTGVIIQCAGSVGAVAGATAATRVVRNIMGVTAAVASVDGALSTTGLVLLSGTVNGCSTLHAALSVAKPQAAPSAARQTETAWLIGALFNGATHAASMLGTSLTQGWFWVRRNGCTAVYRGSGVTQMDFSRILHAAEADAREISLPTYLSHAPGSIHYYLVRRFNSCGRAEKTVAAAAVLRIASDGHWAPAEPNAVHGLRNEPTGATGVRLVWFYCPLDQEAAPERFNVYRGNTAGSVDFENPVAVIRYEGRKFYGWQGVGVLGDLGVFVVQAVSRDDIEGKLSTVPVPPVASSPPESPVVLAAEPS